jgi:ADP-heptose:LPS heptosyltransferase
MKLRGSLPVPAPQRVLFVQPRRIGDVLLCTPAVRAIAEHFPAAKIDFLADAPADEVLWGHPRIERLLVGPAGSSPREWLPFLRKLRAVRYDWAVDFFSNPRSAQYTFASGAKVRVGLDRFGRRWAYTHHVFEDADDHDLYAVDLRLKILAALGVPSAGRQLEIYSDSADPLEVERVEKLLNDLPRDRELIALFRGSINPAKFYPVDLTARLVEGLLAQGWNVVMASGPGETAIAEDVLKLISTPVPHLRGARVPTFAALCRRSALYVGPDSGPKHIAVACGIPAVTLFGLGRVSNWNDPGNPLNVAIEPRGGVPPDCTLEEFIRGEYMRRIPPEDIIDAAISLLKS